MEQDLSGSRIPSHVMGKDPVEAELLETEADHRRGGFAGVSLAPPLSANPESQLRLQMLRVNVSESNTADQRRPW
jgi:hypothetical protein